jgi:hypothetical protein
MAQIPRKAISYVIVSPSGETVSGRRIRESSAWVDSTRRRGFEMGDVESQQAEIAEMKLNGFRCELRDRAQRGLVGNSEFLHIRMSKKDKDALETLKVHYSGRTRMADLSSVIRVLIAEKIESIAAAPKVAEVLRKR